MLSSSWNPHTPLIPLALLIVLSAAVAAGRIGALPLAVFAASLAMQTHVGFAPVSAVLLAVALGLYGLLRKPPRWTADRGDLPRLPVWVRLLDAVALLYLGLLLWVVAFGSFDLQVGGVRIVRASSVGRLALYAVIALVVRHVLARQPSLWRLVTRWLGRHRVGQWLEQAHDYVRPAFPNPDPTVVRRAFAASIAIGAVLWALPAIDELRTPGSGNLSELVTFFGRPADSDRASAFAAFTYYLSRCLAPQLEVAAGGRIWTGADLSPVNVAGATTQLALLAVALWWTASHRKLFHASLCLICLIASAAAFASLARVQGGIYDHLAFWVSIIGVVNIATIAAAALGGLSEALTSGQAWARLSHRLAWAAFTLFMAVYGASHVWRGHHHRRFQPERDRVQRLSGIVVQQVAGGALTAVDMTQSTWSVASGVVLELYKAAESISVHDRWIFLFGKPLMARDQASVELMFADTAQHAALAGDSGYRLIGEDEGVFVYTRTP